MLFITAYIITVIKYMKKFIYKNIKDNLIIYFKISPFLYTLHLNFWFEGREHISALAGAL